MVKPTPDLPIVLLPPDYSRFHWLGVFERVDSEALAARCNAQNPAPPKPCDLQRG